MILPAAPRATTGRPLVKLCGIMSPEHALVAADAGADMIGLVFAESRRRVDLQTADAISQAVYGHVSRPLLVGVFVNESPANVLKTARVVGLDIVQLSGDETPEEAEACAAHFPVIKAFRFDRSVSLDRARERMEPYMRSSADMRPLVDAYHPTEYGGTGEIADWELAALLSAETGLMLAGGLQAGNVGLAIKSVRPWAIDVSSGIERDGVKDAALMREFVGAARHATIESEA